MRTLVVFPQLMARGRAGRALLAALIFQVSVVNRGRQIYVLASPFQVELRNQWGPAERHQECPSDEGTLVKGKEQKPLEREGKGAGLAQSG